MLDKLDLLLALARERHFGRAAERAGVTQPTLSSALKSLEQQFGVRIVERGARFRGFTPEGERVLDWARRLTAEARAMRADIQTLRQGLSGRLTLGVIPTALPVVADLAAPLLAAHAEVGLRVVSLTSDQIVAGLENLELDAGITYLDAAVTARLACLPLYDERYVLVVAPGTPLAGRKTVTWAEAAAQPLCLLTPDMQNRRIVDSHLAEAGAVVAPRIESNSHIVLHTHVRTGAFAAIMPALFSARMDPAGSLVAIPLIEPDAAHTVGLVAARRDPQAPLVAALFRQAERGAGLSG